MSRAGSAGGMADSARRAPEWSKKKAGVQHPFTEAVVNKAILELPDGARLAVSTCLDLWRDKKFGTDEFVSFMKCYAEQSETLAKFFAKEVDSSHSDSTGGGNSVHSSSRDGGTHVPDDDAATSELSHERATTAFLAHILKSNAHSGFYMIYVIGH